MLKLMSIKLIYNLIFIPYIVNVVNAETSSLMSQNCRLFNVKSNKKHNPCKKHKSTIRRNDISVKVQKFQGKSTPFMGQNVTAHTL